MWAEDVDLQRVAYPIAAPMSRLRRSLAEGSTDVALDSFFSLVEESVRVANAVLLANALRHPSSLTVESARLMSRRRSFGDRVQLLVHLTRGLAGVADAEPLRAQLGARSGNLGSQLLEIVAMRNRVSHGMRPGPTQTQSLFSDGLERLDSLTAVHEWISDLELLSVFAPASPGGTTVTAMSWMGPEPTFSEFDVHLVLRNEPFEIRSGTVIRRRADQHLVVSPCLIVRDDPRLSAPELFSLESVVAGGPGGLQATWANLCDSSRPHPPGADSDLTHYYEIFTPWTNSTTESAEPSLNRFYFGTTPGLMHRMLENYVERPDIPGAIDEALRERDSGALWITAGPGAGKSSVLSAIVKRYGAVHHFVSVSEGRNHQPSILRSLIAQLLMRARSTDLPTAEDEGLAQQLGNLLVLQSRTQAESEVTIIALDALDELGDAAAIEQFLSAFPSELPSGIYLVASSRPLPPEVRLPPGTKQLALPPLSVADVSAVAEKHGITASARDCERAYVASRGNPLFVVWALSLIRDSPDSAVATADGLEDLLGPLLMRPLLSEDENDVVGLLSALVAVRVPIDVATLSMASGVARATVLRVISALRDVLSIQGTGVALGHLAVRDYLILPTSVYGLQPQQIAAAHRSLALVAASGRSRLPEGESLWHALNSRDLELLLETLANPTMRDAFPAVLQEATAADSVPGAEIVESLGSRGDTLGREMALVSIDALAASGKWEVAREGLERPWGATLPSYQRDMAELSIARARDDIGEMGVLAERLLPQLRASSAPAAAISRVAFLRAEASRVNGHHRRAHSEYAEAVALAVPGSSEEFSTAFQLADLDYVYGELDRAEERLEELLNLSMRRRDVVWETRISRELGHVALSRGRSTDACDWYMRSLDLALATGRERLITQAYVSLAEATCPTDPNRCLVLVELGLEHAETSGALLERGKARSIAADALLLLDEPERALEAAETSLAELIRVGYGSGQARANLEAARALLALGRFDAAAMRARESLDYYRRERIYPHLWHRALDLWIESTVQSQGVIPDQAQEFQSEIPQLPV